MPTSRRSKGRDVAAIANQFGTPVGVFVALVGAFNVIVPQLQQTVPPKWGPWVALLGAFVAALGRPIAPVRSRVQVRSPRARGAGGKFAKASDGTPDALALAGAEGAAVAASPKPRRKTVVRPETRAARDMETAIAERDARAAWEAEQATIRAASVAHLRTQMDEMRQEIAALRAGAPGGPVVPPAAGEPAPAPRGEPV